MFTKKKKLFERKSKKDLNKKNEVETNLNKVEN